MAAGKPILGVLEDGTEVRSLIEECGCGRCCEPGDYAAVGELIRWYINNSDPAYLEKMGMNGRNYLEKYLTKDVSIKKYSEAIKNLG